MNRTIVQLSLTTILLAALASVCPVANAQDTTPTTVGTVLATSDAGQQVPHTLESKIVGARQYQMGTGFNGERPLHPYRITASRYFADSNSITRGVGSLGSFGFEYDYRANRFFGGPSVLSLYLDVSNNKRYVRNASAEYNATIIGVGIAGRRVFGRSLEKDHSYLGVGIGVYGTQYTIDPFGPEKYKRTDFSPGARLITGYQFDKNLYVQADLLALDSLRIRNASGQNFRANPSGVRIGLGYRF